MDPFQYQQQQLQYQAQFGQQQIQYVPYAAYGVQQPMYGQYGGAYAYAAQTNMAMGLTTGTVPQAQGQQQALNTTPAFSVGQNQTVLATPTYQYAAQPVTSTSATAMAGFPSAMPAMVDIGQKYTEEYQKWQKEYSEWQAKHANHPDQKLFQEYQQQVNQLQQQQPMVNLQGAPMAVNPQVQPVVNTSTPQIGTAQNLQTPQQPIHQSNQPFSSSKQGNNTQIQTPQKASNNPTEQKTLTKQQIEYQSRFVKASEQKKPFGGSNQAQTGQQQHNQSQQQTYRDVYAQNQPSNNQTGGLSMQNIGQEQSYNSQQQSYQNTFNKNNQGNNWQQQQQKTFNNTYNKNQQNNYQQNKNQQNSNQQQNRQLQNRQQLNQQQQNKTFGNNPKNPNQWNQKSPNQWNQKNPNQWNQKSQNQWNQNTNNSSQFNKNFSHTGKQESSFQYQKPNQGQNVPPQQPAVGQANLGNQGRNTPAKSTWMNTKPNQQSTQDNNPTGTGIPNKQPTWMNTKPNQQSTQDYNPTGTAIPNKQPTWMNTKPNQQSTQDNNPTGTAIPNKQPTWMNTKPNQQSTQDNNPTGTAAIPNKQPTWMNAKSNQPNTINPQNNSASPAKSLPKWLQSSEQPKQQNEPAMTKNVPKWMKENENQAQKSDVSTSNTVPKWLKSDSTSNTSSSQPKWLQKTRTHVQEQAKAYQQETTPTKPQEAKSLPKWLQQDAKPTSTSNLSPSKQPATTTSTSPSSMSTTHAATSFISSTSSSEIPGLTNTSTSSSVLSDTVSGIPGIKSQKLNAKEELELLQKQSLQLKQLAELEKKQKEAKAESKGNLNQQSEAVGTSNDHNTDSSNTTKEITPVEQPIPGHVEADKPLQQQPNEVKNSPKPPPFKPFLKSVPCRFFPTCRNGATCKFKHPACPNGLSCTDPECIYDHTETDEVAPDKPPDISGDQRTQPPTHPQEPYGVNSRYGPEDERWRPDTREDYRSWNEEQRDWRDERWREEWPGEHDRRPLSPREREWAGRPREHDDWDRERDRDHYQGWDRRDDYRDERRDRWESRDMPPIRDDDRYEHDRWRRPPEDWDYRDPDYRDRRPPSPSYRRDVDYNREGRERPYGHDDREPYPYDYDRYDRPPPPDDRRRDWYDREYEARDLEWRDRREPSDRYPPKDYHHGDRWTPPREEWRDNDRERYREPEPGPERFDRREREDGYREWNRDPMRDRERYQEPPRDVPPVEKKTAVVVPVESILDKPGRGNRPDRIVIILRGLPGSGKTHVARLIKDKEVSHGAHAPRIIGLDDYFLTEVEKKEKDPETGKMVKKKVTEYVYEEEMEEAYMASMFKVFTKTLEDGFFPVVMVDAINNKVDHFEKYWSLAKQKGFEVYIAELSADAHICAKRNSHQRSFGDISKMLNEWEEIPTHMLRLDVRALLQDAVITEVEMEAAEEQPQTEKDKPTEEGNNEEEDEPIESGMQIHLPQKSKWEDMDSSAAEAQLNKLDGIRPLKRRRPSSPIPSYSDDDDDDPYDEKEEDMRIGKKRVRWADLEEKKHMEHRRRIGFCIGTDWSILTDPHAKIPEH